MVQVQKPTHLFMLSACAALGGGLVHSCLPRPPFPRRDTLPTNSALSEAGHALVPASCCRVLVRKTKKLPARARLALLLLDAHQTY